LVSVLSPEGTFLSLRLRTETAVFHISSHRGQTNEPPPEVMEQGIEGAKATFRAVGNWIRA